MQRLKEPQELVLSYPDLELINEWRKYIRRTNDPNAILELCLHEGQYTRIKYTPTKEKKE